MLDCTGPVTRQQRLNGFEVTAVEPLLFRENIEEVQYSHLVAVRVRLGGLFLHANSR